MTDQTDLPSLTLSGVARRCAHETELFFRRESHDPRYCFELFRRAIVERNQRSWQLVYAQYRPLVTGWVERVPAFPTSAEEAQYFVNRAFEKMWAAIPASRFSRFLDLKALLRYLQMCVHSVILDHVRRAEQQVMKVQVDVSVGGSNACNPAIESEVLDRVRRQEFWGEISARLRDEKERQVVHGSFVLALKPRELYAQSRETFRDVGEIYRIKENVLARLRRDTALQRLLVEEV